MDTSTNQEKNQTQEYQEWVAALDKLPFLERAKRMKDKIVESDELSADDKKFFTDCFLYVCDLYKKNKPLDSNLLRIHLGIKGYDQRQPQKMEQFIRTLMLLGLCGFEF